MTTKEPIQKLPNLLDTGGVLDQLDYVTVNTNAHPCLPKDQNPTLKTQMDSGLVKYIYL